MISAGLANCWGKAGKADRAKARAIITTGKTCRERLGLMMILYQNLSGLGAPGGNLAGIFVIWPPEMFKGRRGQGFSTPQAPPILPHSPEFRIRLLRRGEGARSNTRRRRRTGGAAHQFQHQEQHEPGQEQFMQCSFHGRQLRGEHEAKSTLNQAFIRPARAGAPKRTRIPGPVLPVRPGSFAKLACLSTTLPWRWWRRRLLPARGRWPGPKRNIFSQTIYPLNQLSGWLALS